MPSRGTHASDFVRNGNTVSSPDCPHLFQSCGVAFACFCPSTKATLDQTHSFTCELLMFERLLRNSALNCRNRPGEPTRSSCEIPMEIGFVWEPRRLDRRTGPSNRPHYQTPANLTNPPLSAILI